MKLEKVTFPNEVVTKILGNWGDLVLMDLRFVHHQLYKHVVHELNALCIRHTNFMDGTYCCDPMRECVRVFLVGESVYYARTYLNLYGRDKQVTLYCPVCGNFMEVYKYYSNMRTIVAESRVSRNHKRGIFQPLPMVENPKKIDEIWWQEANKIIGKT